MSKTSKSWPVGSLCVYMVHYMTYSSNFEQGKFIYGFLTHAAACIVSNSQFVCWNHVLMLSQRTSTSYLEQVPIRGAFIDSWPFWRLLNSYGCFYLRIDVYDVWSMLQIDDNDPNAALTRKRVDSIKQTCKLSGLIKRRYSGWFKSCTHLSVSSYWSSLVSWFCRGYHLDKSPYKPMLVSNP
jgi:hypothetical protein